ncbi:unnamed protein product [Jaminaea pallidilutea]
MAATSTGSPNNGSHGGGHDIADERTPLLSPAQETQLSSEPPKSSPSPTRQVAPDLLRGVLMILMALDHCSVSLGAYPHGTGVVSEAASVVIVEWNQALPYLLRTSTHLVASGFSLLMGLGIAFFVSSRSQQKDKGWTVSRQLRHVFTRSIAIIVVNFLSIQLTAYLRSGFSQPIYILNAVLWALAIDYLFVGVLYVLWIAYGEPALASTLSSLQQRQRRRSRVEDGNERDGDDAEVQPAATVAASTKPPTSSYVELIVNTALVILGIVALWANVWTSPDQGHCKAATSAGGLSTSVLGSETVEEQLFSVFSQQQPQQGLQPMGSDQGNVSIQAGWPPTGECPAVGTALYDFFFKQVACSGIVSAFPPVGWLSFVFFGVAYGRVLMISRRRNVSAQLINSTLAVFFAVLFVSTRLFDWGNLSSGCLRTIDQTRPGANPNQYLDSIRSFFYTTKYPPSPAFAFYTLSGNFVLLVLFDVILVSSSRAKRVLLNPSNLLMAYGLQPLFFYLVHFHLINIATMVLPHITRIPYVDGRAAVGLTWPFPLTWVFVLAGSWVACAYYGMWKKSRGPDSVWRFL